MANPAGPPGGDAKADFTTQQMPISSLIGGYNIAQGNVVSAMQAITGTKDVDVSQYMKLQIAMNQLNQIGTLITTAVSSLNHLVTQAIGAMTSR